MHKYTIFAAHSKEQIKERMKLIHPKGCWIAKIVSTFDSRHFVASLDCKLRQFKIDASFILYWQDLSNAIDYLILREHQDAQLFRDLIENHTRNVMFREPIIPVEIKIE